jgi:hypothetical protein
VPGRTRPADHWRSLDGARAAGTVLWQSSFRCDPGTFAGHAADVDDSAQVAGSGRLKRATAFQQPVAAPRVPPHRNGGGSSPRLAGAQGLGGDVGEASGQGRSYPPRASAVRAGPWLGADVSALRAADAPVRTLGKPQRRVRGRAADPACCFQGRRARLSIGKRDARPLRGIGLGRHERGGGGEAGAGQATSDAPHAASVRLRRYGLRGIMVKHAHCGYGAHGLGVWTEWARFAALLL